MSQMGRENFVYTRWRGAPAPILPNKDETVRKPYFKKQLAKSSNNLANYCFLLANFLRNKSTVKPGNYSDILVIVINYLAGSQ